MLRLKNFLAGKNNEKASDDMARRSRPNDIPEKLRQSLIELLTNFSEELKKSNLRSKVVALVPAFHTLRDLGSSLIPKSQAISARDRIISYLKQYPRTVIDGDELMVVSGINEWARRVRELREMCIRDSIETMEEQLKAIGGTWDWDYEVKTCMPDYYKWTQWCFLQLYRCV